MHPLPGVYLLFTICGPSKGRPFDAYGWLHIGKWNYSSLPHIGNCSLDFISTACVMHLAQVGTPPNESIEVLEGGYGLGVFGRV